MHPAFATISFGPFKSAYHKAATGPTFREDLSQFLEKTVLPQVDEHFVSTKGRITAKYDDDKHCGPKSAVRDIYALEFAFIRPGGQDELISEILYQPTRRTFTPRVAHKPPYLWTNRRKTVRNAQIESIKNVCQLILGGKISQAACPICNADLVLC